MYAHGAYFEYTIIISYNYYYLFYSRRVSGRLKIVLYYVYIYASKYIYLQFGIFVVHAYSGVYCIMYMNVCAC